MEGLFAKACPQGVYSSQRQNDEEERRDSKLLGLVQSTGNDEEKLMLATKSQPLMPTEKLLLPIIRRVRLQCQRCL
jgi:hypothetical protein